MSRYLFIPFYQDDAPDLSGIRNDVSSLRVALGPVIEDDSHTGIGASDYDSLKDHLLHYLRPIRTKHAECRGVILFFTGHGWVDHNGTFECLKDVKIREVMDWIRGETWEQKDIFVIVDACRVREGGDWNVAAEVEGKGQQEKRPVATMNLGVRADRAGSGKTAYLFACPRGSAAFETDYGAQRFGRFTRALIDLLNGDHQIQGEEWLTFSEIEKELSSKLDDQSPQAEGAVSLPFLPVPKRGEAIPIPSDSPIWPHDWAEVIQAEPDPSAVTDEEGRTRMFATDLPWWIKDKRYGIEFRLVPPGRFMMGSDKAQVVFEDPEERGWLDIRDEPLHPVIISKPFYLSVTPVTQAQWQRVMQAVNPSHFKDPERPVENMPFSHIVGKDRLAGPDTFLGLTGCRLPTEAEWEYACRAGTTTATYAGDLKIIGEHNAPVLEDIAWYGGNCGVDFDLEEGWEVDENDSQWRERAHEFSMAGTRKVGQKFPNPWGFHDMLGNVSEYCSDWYVGDPTGGVGTVLTDPKGPPTGDKAILRGGSFRSAAKHLRVGCRGWSKMFEGYVSAGLRLARGPE